MKVPAPAWGGWVDPRSSCVRRLTRPQRQINTGRGARFRLLAHALILPTDARNRGQRGFHLQSSALGCGPHPHRLRARWGFQDLRLLTCWDRRRRRRIILAGVPGGRRLPKKSRPASFSQIDLCSWASWPNRLLPLPQKAVFGAKTTMNRTGSSAAHGGSGQRTPLLAESLLCKKISGLRNSKRSRIDRYRPKIEPLLLTRGGPRRACGPTVDR